MSVGASDAIVGKLKEAGAAKLTYTRYAPGLAPGAPKLPGHASYELAFADAGLWPWLLEQRL